MIFRTTFALVLLLCASSPAFAEDYAKPGWTNLLHTLIRFNALNLSNDRLIDEYAMVTECDLYKGFYNDDFKWNKVRQAIRQSINLNVDTFPTSYHYDTTLQLEHYDFHDKLYRFTSKTTIKNINAFVIYQVEGSPCKDITIKLVPQSYRAVLDTPLYFEGLPLSQTDAEGLLQQMKADHNTDRVIYTRFNLRIVYVDPLRLISNGGESMILKQTNSTDIHTVRLDAHLDSIDFYEDEGMTKLVYHYQP